MTKKTQTFQAETRELLNLMIHSLYSHRDIFLRELISNASDAIEKLKFESLTQPGLKESGQEFEIRLDTNEEKKTLSVSDNGIGMNYDEVVQNIGTIAHSGTKSFLKMGQEVKNHPELIGQFGVGFYSAFMVADRVTLHTQKAGTTTGVLWESDGTGTYTIEEMTRPEGHGTTLTLHLREAKKEDEEESEHEVSDYTDPWTLRQIVKKYSDFIAFPIRMKVKKEKPVESKSEGEAKSEPKMEVTFEDETLNSQKALWLRPSSEITPEEYTEFYKHLSHDWSDPLKTIHYKAEGAMEFASILFIPSQRPFNYDYQDRKIGLSLYVKRVFIKGDCEELLPPYLRFVKGMVDSDDLSLNVSRELLQQDKQIARIKKAITNKVLSTLKETFETNRKDYEKFWASFGSTLKEGVALDSAQADKIQEVLLFNTTHSAELTSLREYMARMKPLQKAIYFITGDSLTQLQNSPYLEKLKAKGLEVLLMADRVDAWVSGSLREFDKLPFQSITSESLELSSEDERKEEQAKIKESEDRLKPLMDVMKEVLKDHVQEVKLSDRLTESPVCLVSSKSGASAHMERLMESIGQNMPKAKRILEINPFHPLFERMLKAPKNVQEDLTDILYQQALLNEGSKIENPLSYSQKITNLMLSASGSLL